MSPDDLQADVFAFVEKLMADTGVELDLDEVWAELLNFMVPTPAQ